MLNTTANKILNIAERFTQTLGVNAFSYKDIQQELGIKTSSIHYYFPTKQDLIVAMLERYLENYAIMLEEINHSSSDSSEKLYRLGKVFTATGKKGKFCLCGMLATDISTLSKPVKLHLAKFLQLNQSWIIDVVKQGISNQEFHKHVDVESFAAQYLSILEGGLLISRVRNNTKYLQNIIEYTLNQIMT